MIAELFSMAISPPFFYAVAKIISILFFVVLPPVLGKLLRQKLSFCPSASQQCGHWETIFAGRPNCQCSSSRTSQKKIIA